MTGSASNGVGERDGSGKTCRIEQIGIDTLSGPGTAALSGNLVVQVEWCGRGADVEGCPACIGGCLYGKSLTLACAAAAASYGIGDGLVAGESGGIKL